MAYKRHHAKSESGSAEGVKARKGEEWFKNAAKAGMQDPHVGSSGTKRYSGAEVRAEVTEGGMDAGYYRKLRADGAKFSGNAQDYLYDTFGLDFGAKGKGKSKGGMADYYKGLV